MLIFHSVFALPLRTSPANPHLTHLPRCATGRNVPHVRVSVPYPLVRVGDVIDDLGQFAVVTRTLVAEDEKVGVIRSVCDNGQRRETVYPPSATTSQLSRVGEGCVPTPEGLHDFLVQHVHEIAG